jgi:hypothetical protein
MSMDNFQLVDVSPDIPHSNIRKKLKSASHWTMTQKDKKNLDLLEDMEMALFMEELENGGPSSSKGLERSIYTRYLVLEVTDGIDTETGQPEKVWSLIPIKIQSPNLFA